MEEKEVCEECDSENIIDVVYEGRMAKLCPTCARMNGAVIINTPTTEQITKADRSSSLQERVKSWRKERQGSPEANLDTLRRRKQELNRDKEKQEEEKIKKEIEETKQILDFHSREVTISDLKKMKEIGQTIEPVREPVKIAPKPRQDSEIELNAFMQEANRVKDEEKLEEELEVPVPLEPLQEQDEQEEEPRPEPNPEPWPQPNPQTD